MSRAVGLRIFDKTNKFSEQTDLKLTIAYLWQLMRYHAIKCAEGFDEKQLLKWSNSVVPEDV